MLSDRQREQTYRTWYVSRGQFRHLRSPRAAD